ncbi:hypothetical protein [Arthrobacter sp. H35-D1]|uniref:hypothetical protein n=1 Tax=Arthrobacter sp. H35-D1 TaxID=3046202 RepID=UPI0024B87CA4|nr:hypothetical protein [Arthrobacter sp. H35-D1]MDJ0315476.1 hypothetical protein [Arthrobacter sp. H35-D1]
MSQTPLRPEDSNPLEDPEKLVEEISAQGTAGQTSGKNAAYSEASAPPGVELEAASPTVQESERKIVVGIVADPGLPLSLAMELQDSLPNLLTRDVDSGVAWEVQVMAFSLPLDTFGELELNIHSERLRHESSWDYLVYLTDLPKYENGEPLTSSLNVDNGSAVIVVPALGIVRRKRLQRAVEQVLAKLHGVNDPFLRHDGTSPLVVDPFSVERRIEAEESGGNSVETVKGFRGRVLLLIGMVRSNRPWRLVPRLSSAMAAALATGAFGIFYTSIWSMADYLPTRRLVIIALLSIMIIGSWLVLHNKLWERPHGVRQKEKRVLYNLATLLTLLLAMLLMYVALFLIILAGALIIIDPAFLAMQLDGDVGFREYVNLSWLSASLGIVAGAVGSSFDDEESVRKATFSRREYERRQISLENETEKDT